MEALGGRIKKIRKVAGYNQKELGAVLGVVASAISAYENGERSPTYENLIKIAELGKVSIDWLLTGKEHKTQTGISATINPGNEVSKKRLIEAGERATNRNIHLRQIVEWMDNAFGENEEQALFFYEDLKERYPSFADFMEKKRPGADHMVAERLEKYNKGTG